MQAKEERYVQATPGGGDQGGWKEGVVFVWVNSDMGSHCWVVWSLTGASSLACCFMRVPVDGKDAVMCDLVLVLIIPIILKQ